MHFGVFPRLSRLERTYYIIYYQKALSGENSGKAFFIL